MGFHHFSKGNNFCDLCLLHWAKNPSKLVGLVLLTLIHSEQPKLHRVLAILSVVRLKNKEKNLLLVPFFLKSLPLWRREAEW